MAFEIRPHPDWSWSASRRGCFRECLRRYYWQYYGSHNGWLREAPEAARRAYRLKKLKSLPLLLGEVLHDLFARTLREVRGGKAAPAAEDLVQAARGRMNQAWAQSKRRQEWEARPKDLVMLHEMYYGPEPSDERFAALRGRLGHAVAGFLASRSFREAASAPFQELRDVDRQGHFEVDGTRVYAQPDLLYKLGDGTWTIVDWKTGGEGEGHAVQLGIYGLYLRAGHGASGPIAGRLEYVAEGRREDVALDDAALDAAEREIRDGIAAMRGYLDDPDANRPRPIEAFPLREDRRDCPWCSFYELCQPEIEGGSGLDGPF